MEILNIGPWELVIFLIIAFLLLGPKGMILTAYRIGTWIRSAVRSPMWREILHYAQEIRELPKKLMDETGLEAELKNVQQTTTDAMKEVDQTLKEVAEAARVPEAEHLRLQTGPESVPASSKPSGAQQFIPLATFPSLTETGEVKKMTSEELQAAAGTQPAAAEAVEENPTAEPAAVVEPEASQVEEVPPAPVQEEAQPMTAADKYAARRAAIKKRLEKIDTQNGPEPVTEITEDQSKAAAQPELDAPADFAAQDEVVAQPPARKRAVRRKTVEQLSETTAAPAEVTPELPPVEQVQPVVRKRAARKTQTEPPNGAKPAVLDVAESSDQVEIPSALSAEPAQEVPQNGSEAGANNEAKPVRRPRKPRVTQE